MLTWIIQISLISIIFIFLVHHLLMFFKKMLTVPKIKDLVNSPNQKFQNIYDTISHKSSNDYKANDYKANDYKGNDYKANDYKGNDYKANDYSEIELLPNDNFVSSIDSLTNKESNSMKNELKSFLKKQLNEHSDNLTGIDSSSLSLSSNYSNF